MAQEKNFENKIKAYLKKKDCYHVKFFANAFTKKGVPDILACINGFFVGIEVKAENGKVSALQIYNREQIKKCGGIAMIVKPSQWNDLKNTIDFLLEYKEEK
jgi:Holliday junction resolvase